MWASSSSVGAVRGLVVSELSRICVVFAGNSGAGKDTAADMFAAICQKRGISNLRTAFADPIKEIVSHLLGIPKEVTYGSQQDKLDFQVYGKTARHWIQWVGTQVGRDQIHEDLWVHRTAQLALESSARVVIVSDGRFMNEFQGMRTNLREKMKVFVIKVVNPRVPVNLEHQSESEIYFIPEDQFDQVFYNTKGLGDLECFVECFANSVLSKIESATESKV